MNLGIYLFGFDFNFVPVDDELRPEAEGFALQRQVDEFNGLVHLLGGRAVRDLAGVKLEVEPADSDGFHGVLVYRPAILVNHSCVVMVSISLAVMKAAPPP